MATTDSPIATFFREAKHYGRYSNLPVSRLVIHDMEYPERPTGAEWCVDFFATTNKVASAHYSCDNNSVGQSVREEFIAYHAPPNTRSIGIEHAGYAAQSRTEWLDDYSTAELKLSARLAADICKRHDIPIVKLSVQDLKDGKRGICGHVDVSNAFHKTDHGDPGGNFPWDQYLAWVRGENEEDDLPYTEAQLMKIIADAIAPLAAETAALGRLVEKLEIRTRLNYVKDGVTVETLGTDVKALHDALPDG